MGRRTGQGGGECTEPGAGVQAAEQLGAQRYQRTNERQGYRNGLTSGVQELHAKPVGGSTEVANRRLPWARRQSDELGWGQDSVRSGGRR